MTNEKIMQILKDTAYVHTSGTEEELKVAQYLKACCEEMGVKAWLEPFKVQMADMKKAELTVDGEKIPCEGYRLCGSSTVEAPMVYLPNTDAMSLSKVKGKIVLVDTGITYFLYRDLLAAGAVGYITYNGSFNVMDDDIDKKELRPHVACGELLPGVNVHARTAARLVAMEPKTVRIEIEQNAYEGQSHDVVAEIPGETDEWIVLTAHYDTTPLSVGSYDNMTGCLGLLGVMEQLKDRKLRYGLRFVFCGSEERGLLGSKAYVAAHEAELGKIALNINLDMIGTVMGRFIACVSAEEKLHHFIEYFAAIRGFGIKSRCGVYSSDSTPFADKGVPALSFARLATPSQAVIHNRYDTMAVLSAERIAQDTAFIADFTETMASAVKCPVSREIPENIKTQLDEYLARKRKAD